MSYVRPLLRFAAVCSAATLLALPSALLSSPGYAGTALTQLGSAPTEVGSDTYQNGTTIFTAYRAGIRPDGGADGVGYAAYNKQQGTWTNGSLGGITTAQGGAYGAVADVRVAYSLSGYNIWLIATLVTGGPGGTSAILVSRSIDDGRTFYKPVTAATGQLTGLWFACDFSFQTSCYLGYTVRDAGNVMRMRVSGSAGLSWGPEQGTADNATGFGRRAVAQTNGTVVVPYVATTGELRAFRSTNFGASWEPSVRISDVQHHTVAGGLNTNTLPSVDADYYGRLFVAWSDCRYRTGCAANDIVFSKSTDGTVWTAPARVPIDPATGTADHFLPALGVDRTSYYPASTRLGLAYYSYPNAGCTASTCQLQVGFVSSTNGGASWSAPVQLAGPMSLAWLTNTPQGRTVGDAFSTDVAWGGNAFPVVSVASAPVGGALRQAMVVPAGGLAITGGAGVLVPPTAPTHLNAVALSSSSAGMSWFDNDSNESGFAVERCRGVGCTNFAQIAVNGTDDSSFTDTGLTGHTSYSYRVRAFNAAGSSAYSNTATITTN